jgi:hypothetical protein
MDRKRLKSKKLEHGCSCFRDLAGVHMQRLQEDLMKFSKYAVLLMVLIFGFSTSVVAASPEPFAINDLLQPPYPDKPTQADVSFFIDNVSDIDLNSGSYKIVGQMVVEWRDPRLAFAPDPDYPDRPRNLNADAASELLKKIWEPVFEISNEREERKTGVVSLNVWPDGRIRYYEKFDSFPNFQSNLAFYPYGTVDLNLVMTGFLQDRGELIYNLKVFEFQDRNRPEDFIHGHWKFISMEATERPAKRSDDRSVEYSQIHFKVKLNHESIESGALTIFVPLFVIFIASSAVLWLDPAKVPSYASPRLGGTLTLILTTVALKYSLAKQIPSLQYITMTDLLLIETILLLVISLLLSVVYIWMYAEKSELAAKKFNRNVRIFYPFAFVSVIAVSIFIFSLASKTSA